MTYKVTPTRFLYRHSRALHSLIFFLSVFPNSIPSPRGAFRALTFSISFSGFHPHHYCTTSARSSSRFHSTLPKLVSSSCSRTYGERESKSERERKGRKLTSAASSSFRIFSIPTPPEARVSPFFSLHRSTPHISQSTCMCAHLHPAGTKMYAAKERGGGEISRPGSFLEAACAEVEVNYKYMSALHRLLDLSAASRSLRYRSLFTEWSIRMQLKRFIPFAEREGVGGARWGVLMPCRTIRGESQKIEIFIEWPSKSLFYLLDHLLIGVMIFAEIVWSCGYPINFKQSHLINRFLHINSSVWLYCHRHHVENLPKKKKKQQHVSPKKIRW